VVLFGFLLAATLGVARAAPALRIETRARAMMPGEGIRIVVSGPEGLASVEGRFLDQVLFFTSEAEAKAGGASASAGAGGTGASAGAGGASASAGAGGAPAAWSAWAVVPLDAKPGAAEITVAAKAPGGAEMRQTRMVRIAPKKFPVSKLKVASEFVEPPPAVQERIARETARLKEVYATRRPLPPPSAPFRRPVPGEQIGVFGARRVFNGQPRAPHPGLDLRAPVGTKVSASGPGRVALASDLYFSGGTVILDHGGGFFTVYAHLSKILVKEGDEVAEGALLGLSGATGRVTGPHLHWGAKVGDRPFDPTALLDSKLFAP